MGHNEMIESGTFEKLLEGIDKLERALVRSKKGSAGERIVIDELKHWLELAERAELVADGD